MCGAIYVTNDAWSQAQLGLKYGGLGLRSLSHHYVAAFIASLSFSGLEKADNIHLQQAVAVFNTQVSHSNVISLWTHKVMSGMIQPNISTYLVSSYAVNRVHLLSVAAPCAASWLSVVPSPGLGLNLEPNEPLGGG